MLAPTAGVGGAVVTDPTRDGDRVCLRVRSRFAPAPATATAESATAIVPAPASATTPAATEAAALATATATAESATASACACVCDDVHRSAQQRGTVVVVGDAGTFGSIPYTRTDTSVPCQADAGSARP